MPLVHIYAHRGSTFDNNADFDFVRLLCQEIIPAVLSTKKFSLQPEDIEVIYENPTEAHLTTDVLVKISAYSSNRRWKQRGTTAKLIASTLTREFNEKRRGSSTDPQLTFSVALSLDLSAWASSASSVDVVPFGKVSDKIARALGRAGARFNIDPENSQS